MNYTSHYDALIRRAQSREYIEQYGENHHIVPRCMGGSDDQSNMVMLSPEEHYVAHQLLAKIHPYNRDLSLAVIMMCRGGHTLNRSNKMYGWVRRLSNGKGLSEETKRKISESHKGKMLTDEQKNKLRSTAFAVGNQINTGRVHTAATRQNMSIAQTGRKHDDTTKRKIGDANRIARAEYNYHTPLGVFTSFNDFERKTGLSTRLIQNRCVTSNDKANTPRTLASCKDITKGDKKKYLGKTWKELGWYRTEIGIDA